MDIKLKIYLKLIFALLKGIFYNTLVTKIVYSKNWIKKKFIDI